MATGRTNGADWSFRCGMLGGESAGVDLSRADTLQAAIGEVESFEDDDDDFDDEFDDDFEEEWEDDVDEDDEFADEDDDGSFFGAEDAEDEEE